jgi:hypothetical protein
MARKSYHGRKTGKIELRSLSWLCGFVGHTGVADSIAIAKITQPGVAVLLEPTLAVNVEISSTLYLALYYFRITSVPAIMSCRACFFSVNPAMM